MKKRIPEVVAIKSKKEGLLMRAVIVEKNNRTGAVWLTHPEQIETHYCSYCHYVYHEGTKKLPSSCPQCNADMIKGTKAKNYLEIMTALKEKQGSNEFIFNESEEGLIS